MLENYSFLSLCEQFLKFFLFFLSFFFLFSDAPKSSVT